MSKNCQKIVKKLSIFFHHKQYVSDCACDRMGTEECDHNSGECRCLPGVEGELCDRCKADHWGFSSGEPVSNENEIL